jgi:hypothetical protein
MNATTTFEFFTDPNRGEMMRVTRNDLFGNGPFQMDMPAADTDRIKAFAEDGMKVQEAFPRHSADEREFILNGLLPDAYEKIHEKLKEKGHVPGTRD